MPPYAGRRATLDWRRLFDGALPPMPGHRRLSHAAGRRNTAFRHRIQVRRPFFGFAASLRRLYFASIIMLHRRRRAAFTCSRDAHGHDFSSRPGNCTAPTLLSRILIGRRQRVDIDVRRRFPRILRHILRRRLYECRASPRGYARWHISLPCISFTKIITGRSASRFFRRAAFPPARVPLRCDILAAHASLHAISRESPSIRTRRQSRRSASHFARRPDNLTQQPPRPLFPSYHQMIISRWSRARRASHMFSRPNASAFTHAAGDFAIGQHRFLDILPPAFCPITTFALHAAPRRGQYFARTHTACLRHF